MIKEALEYAARGWAVFPVYYIQNNKCSCGHFNCGSPGKHPMTRHGFKDASTDPKQIKLWWGRWPSANIGIATGSVSGIIVLDVDPPNGVLQLNKQLYNTNSALNTLTSQTGGHCDGRHYYFNHPGSVVRSITGVLPGLDIKGDNGCINAPPSNHISGRTYKWFNNLPLAPLPTWIYSIIHSKNEKHRRDRRASGLIWKRARRWGFKDGKIDLTNIKEIKDKERGNNLISILGQLKAEGMDKTTAITILTQINKERCKPPYPEREFKRLIHSFYSRYN